MKLQNDFILIGDDSNICEEFVFSGSATKQNSLFFYLISRAKQN